MMVNVLKVVLSAVVIILTIGCTEKNPQAPGGLNANQYIVATTMDPTGASGNIGILDLETMTAEKALLPIHTVTLVKTYHKSIYIIEGFGKDNLIRISGKNISQSNITYQNRLGTGTNLQDIAFISDTKAYITQYASPDVLIVNPTDGTVTGRISLKAFGTSTPTVTDSLPFMNPIAVSGNFAYVGCQRLDGGTFTPVDTGLVVKIDVATNTVVTSYPLIHKNPTAITISNGKLYAVCTGTYSDTTDGAIDRIDLASGTVDTLFGDGATGGSLSQSLVIIDATHAYVTAIRNALDWMNAYTVVIMFNPTTGTITKTLTGVDNAFGGMTTDGSRLYVGDQSKNTPGIVVFDGLTGTKSSGPYNVGVNSMSLAYFDLR